MQKAIKKTMEFRKKHLNPLHTLVSPKHPIFVERATGVYFFDAKGNRYLDCVNNVSHVGHCHPLYVQRMNQQMEKLLTNARMLYPNLESCSRKILAKFPSEYKYITFLNSGSEANDLALQIGSCYTNSKKILAIEGAYHGQIQTLLDISSYRWLKKTRKPKDLELISMPCTYRGKFADDEDSTEKYIEELEKKTPEFGKRTFIHESMLSCAGQVIPKRDFFQKVYEFVRKNGGVCSADEVQTGFGRLGSHFWAFEYFGIDPDIVTIGKAMGNGFPVSAVVCKEPLMKKYAKKRKEFFSTYSGNPLACEAAESVLDIIQSEKLQENAEKVGKCLAEKMRHLLRYDFVADHRGMGLFQGIEIVEDKKSKKPSEETAKKIALFCREKNVIVSRDGVYGNIIKIKPPMVFSKENVDELMEVLELACQKIGEKA